MRAATSLVEQHGHAGLSLAQLAERLSVSQPALYRHFANRQALLAEVAARGLVDFDTALTAAITTHANDPYAALEAVGRAYVRFAHANPGWFRLYFSRLNVEDLRSPTTPSPTASPSREALLAALAKLTGPDDPLIFDLFRSTWAIAHGLAVFVVERVFQLVETDAERIAAADDALRAYVECLRARFAPAGLAVQP